MEKKQGGGFFSSIKQELSRGLSPVKSRSKSKPQNQNPPKKTLYPASNLLNTPFKNSQINKNSIFNFSDSFMAKSCSLKQVSKTLPPLIEEPDLHSASLLTCNSQKQSLGKWVQQISRPPSISSTDFEQEDSDKCRIRLLLGVMGAPLAPSCVNSIDSLPNLSIKDTPIESSSALYILQQYIAAIGGIKLLSSMRSFYVMGKVKMAASDCEIPAKLGKNRCGPVQTGGFVLWKMNPDLWFVELGLGGSKIHAGSNGKLVWRHTPWLGPHAAKGPVRPPRRALQGLDPLTTASLFVNSRCIGEKKVNGEDCFILKLSADSETLRSRSEGMGEMIRHVLFGYFSQKTGFLIYMEDSHLTRIQSNSGTDAVYWETTINSFINDYRLVEGVMIAHSGRSVVSLFRFGEAAMSQSKTRMEESWSIEEVSFNVPGLSMDCFIPPADLRLCGSVSCDSKR